MAKEMMILFVYDTQMLKREEDDPSSAILYFHPTWVSDNQKTALCGQLMGTVHCVKSVFSQPKIVSLQSGKFFVKEYGRYLMAVGTDRNIADWLLEHRANILSSLISFFHQDIEMMSQMYDNSSKLSAKLYQFFETYLKYMFLGGNIFSYIPSIKLPKSASNVFLDAIQILQCCQEFNYVLGGTLLYHNKVVATQLSSDITKRIVLTDPYRIRSPAEIPTLNFDLPLGVQLLYVYIPSKEYQRLHEQAARNRNTFQYLTNKNFKKKQKSTSKEPVISAMKRDQSLIFTSVPEEESEHQLVINTEKPSTSQNRPKFLNLKSKTTDFSSEIPKATSFHGQTSVCSTPMTDLNKIIHSRPMSICINPVEESQINVEIDETSSPLKGQENLDKILKSVPFLQITNNLNDKKKCSSVFDIREKLQSIDKSITMKYYNLESKEKSPTKKVLRRQKTITDPNYPIFKHDGSVVSHAFYKDHVSGQIELISTELKDESPQKDFESVADFVRCVTSTENKTPSAPLPKKNSSREHRKSLTLPLKSLDGSDQVASPLRRHSSGVLLTPLMSKLSSFEESGFCTRETTPIYTPTQQNFPFSFKKHKNKLNLSNDGAFQKCILFVCGQQDMVVGLLLQDSDCISDELIMQLWEVCTENLANLEKQLRHCLETYPGSGVQSDSEPYSYLYLDPDWDTVHRGGPWSSNELGALTYFHRDFKENSGLTEISMRCCDGVIYGYQCGNSEVFYHQAANSNAGLPPPTDAMGNVPLKARRRLERDHSIILL